MLKTESIHFTYGKKPVLGGIDIRLKEGELCAVLGNNGSGKSTLLKCIAGILRPQKGAVLLGGHDIARLDSREIARRMAYVPQRETVNLRLTVFDTVLMGRRPHIGWGVQDRDLEIVEKIITTLEMEEFALRYVDELSGGEYQKVSIARALAQEPKVLLLDEPTSNLDLRNQIEVMEMVRTAVRERCVSTIVAIHDINLALRFFNTFLLLRGGAVLARGGAEIINTENIEKTYGVRVKTEGTNGTKMIIPVGYREED